jgi:AcrR family transcriptional regulator
MQLYCTHMPRDVKRDLRAARRSETELRLIEAATALFVDRGYVATTLADVADHAGVAPRTVYLRFATKAALLQRCLDIAIGGDDHDVAVPDRDWFHAAMAAPTLDERIARMAHINAQLMDRAGPLLRVAQQAEALEPEIAARAQGARDQTELLPPGCDLDWLASTGALLGQAETYLLLSRTTGWDVSTYETWLHTTWTRLAHFAPGHGSRSPRE